MQGFFPYGDADHRLGTHTFAVKPMELVVADHTASRVMLYTFFSRTSNSIVTIVRLVDHDSWWIDHDECLIIWLVNASYWLRLSIANEYPWWIDYQ